ncbi:MAG TPA: P-loop NTPase [Frankiaceae bacterium]|nr:P-loop NTPase [Frankiaceae bacterium]
MIVVVEPDALSQEALLGAAGTSAVVVADLDAAYRRINEGPDVDVVLIGPHVAAEPALALAEAMRIARPMLGVVLVRARIDTATLTDALRAGVRDVVKERDVPGIGTAVQRALELARAAREQAGIAVAEGEGEELGRLITVFSAKGGAGKTTVSTNLAAALADGGKRNVCLVDLDLAFGDVAIALQLFPAHTLSDAVPMMDSLDASAVQALLTPHSPGLTTLVAPVEPGAADSIPAPLVGRVLRVLRQLFQFVVVDTPPAFTDHVLAAFDESDYVALLATLDIPALKNLKLTLETLDLLNYPRDRWRVVLNRADSKVGLQLAEVEKTLRVPIAVQIPSSRSVPASVNRGVPIVLDEPNHPVSQAIRQFAETLAAGMPTKALPQSLRTDNRRFGLRRRTEKST